MFVMALADYARMIAPNRALRLSTSVYEIINVSLEAVYDRRFELHRSTQRRAEAKLLNGRLTNMQTALVAVL